MTNNPDMVYDLSLVSIDIVIMIFHRKNWEENLHGFIEKLRRIWLPMKNFIRISYICFILIFLFAIQPVSAANDGSFTQQDRELLIRLDERMNQIDKRFELIDKRFEQIDKRFEQIDKRFEQVDKRFEQVDKRFEQVDKRISELRQDMNNRFEQLMTLLWIVTSVFASLVAAIIGFALWDRHTMLKQARIEFEKGSGLNALLEAARKFAEKNKDFKEALQSVKLL